VATQQGTHRESTQSMERNLYICCKGKKNYYVLHFHLAADFPVCNRSSSRDVQKYPILLCSVFLLDFWSADFSFEVKRRQWYMYV
jgi:hypothetical protein